MSAYDFVSETMLLEGIQDNDDFGDEDRAFTLARAANRKRTKMEKAKGYVKAAGRNIRNKAIKAKNATKDFGAGFKDGVKSAGKTIANNKGVIGGALAGVAVKRGVTAGYKAWKKHQEEKNKPLNKIKNAAGDAAKKFKKLPNGQKVAVAAIPAAVLAGGAAAIYAWWKKHHGKKSSKKD